MNKCLGQGCSFSLHMEENPNRENACFAKVSTAAQVTSLRRLVWPSSGFGDCMQHEMCQWAHSVHLVACGHNRACVPWSQLAYWWHHGVSCQSIPRRRTKHCETGRSHSLLLSSRRILRETSRELNQIKAKLGCKTTDQIGLSTLWQSESL